MNPGRTTARGYGWAHQQARREAIKRLRDGDPCARCYAPMFRSQARWLDLDHTPDRRAYRGLAHRSCNRSAGQAVATANRKTKTQVNSRAW